MKELSNEVKDYLLEYQDSYRTGEPNCYIYDNGITLIYNTIQSREMYVSVLNSVDLLRRIRDKNLKFTDIVCTENALVIEFTLINVA